MSIRPSNSAFKLANWLLLVTGIAASVGYYGHREGVFTAYAPQKIETQVTDVDASADFASISNRLIVESIVAIIQNYYVDENRIRGEYLIQGALRQLFKKYPEIEMTHNKKEVVVSANGREISSFEINPLEYEDLVDTLVEVSKYLQKNHFSDAPVNNLSEPQLTGGYYTVLDSLLRGLDAHSMFLNTEEYDELRQGTEGQFGGLGILVGIRDNLLTVIKPLPNSPALSAGLMKSDKIIKINGVETFGFSLDELVEHMRGEPGSIVDMSVLRSGFNAPINFELSRQKINVNSVTSRIIENGKNKTGYLAIESFSSRTSFELKTALDEVKKETGSKFNGLVLDLRSNPGGLLDQAVQVADLFLEQGVIVSTRGRRQEVEYAESGQDETDYPIVILINGDTASASEIVSGALQDHHRALVVGQPTFGKGTVQTIFELPGGQALKLTVARYYTPEDRSIQTVGIVPDIWLQPLYKLNENADLMGGHHYRSERFLSNHIALQAGYIEEAKLNAYPSFFKGYYLADYNDLPELNGEEAKKDQELELALGIIDSVSKTYGNTLPPGVRRAQHWLGVSSKNTIAKIEDMQRKTEQWLMTKYNIDWGSHNDNATSKLDFEPEWQDLKSIAGGETVQIPFKIKNNDFKTAERLSVFVWTAEGYVYSEKLVGKIKGHQTLEGKIEINVPFGITVDKVNINMAVSIDAVPLSATNQEKTFIVKDASPPKFDISFHYNDRNTNPDGMIDPNESGDLKIIVKNLDDRDYPDLKLKVVSLSGSQLVLQGSESKRIGNLKKGSGVSTEFAVKAGHKISTDSCYLGLEVLSGDRSRLFSKGFSLKSKTNAPPTRSAILMGH